MMREIQNRINKLELTINLLEDHLQKYRHLIHPRPLKFIEGQINFYKRELKIRKDFPS
ncbi:MAG: hypothetical protein ACFE9N_12400 [Promethearchaeota archaeon]